ncbi:chloride channel protein [Desulfonatronum thiodismutans]|uniref:chloride channel protein n=1 Tax=Desulfonatronum thiodismutans TaxID=159290 RepID=UPI00054EBF52|nr:chloride channel protein [Desulfonatronum thiodismutans]
MSFLEPYFRKWGHFIHAASRGGSARWVLLGMLAGLLSGLAAVAFFVSLEGLRHFFLVYLAGLNLPLPSGEDLFHGEPGTYRPWLVPILTASVGILTGFLVSRWIPEPMSGGTDGTDAMIKAFHRQDGQMPVRATLIKSTTAVLTIAGGGSAGREGPMAQLGGCFGSLLANRLGLSVKERRILLLSGAAGGLGAVFRAPLGGAITAVEVLYREDFEAEAILPALISSVTAYSLFTLFFGAVPMLETPEFRFQSAQELPFYIVLALVCALAGRAYLSTFFFIKRTVFEHVRQRAGLVWSMGLGGLLVGMLGVAFPPVLSDGYGWLEMAVLGQLSLVVMLAVFLGKTLATSITLGSGMSGGMFAPALFVGGMCGGVVGQVGHFLLPGVVTQPGGYVLVGMAAFFAGVANAAVGPLIMVCEITQSYGLLVPLMLASALCLVINRDVSLYEHQAENKFDSPAHREDATINVLEELRVQDHFRPGRVIILEEGTTWGALMDVIANTSQFNFPVRGRDDRITGILSIQDVRTILYEQDLCDLLVVKDVARKPVLLRPEDSLYTALMAFVQADVDQIPVVREDIRPETPEVDAHHVLGLINREDVFQAYTQAIPEEKRRACSLRRP